MTICRGFGIEHIKILADSNKELRELVDAHIDFYNGKEIHNTALGDCICRVGTVKMVFESGKSYTKRIGVI